MKTKTEILMTIIGMMILITPAAMGQEMADTTCFSPDTLYFTSESGCPASYNIVDLAIILKICAPLSGEERIEALQLLEDAIQNPDLLGDYFELEYVGPEVDFNDFTVIASDVIPQNDDEGNDDQSDRLLRVYFSPYTMIMEWEGAGYTSINCTPKQQTEGINRVTEMYYVTRHEYEVSQTPTGFTLGSFVFFKKASCSLSSCIFSLK